jgi:NTP pyrophosphatase (non-canonical NTP hydrolase)
MTLPDTLVKERHLYTEKQVQDILTILLREQFFFSFHGNVVPVHAVRVEGAGNGVCIFLQFGDGMGTTSVIIPLSKPLTVKHDYTQEVLRTYAGEDTCKEKLTLGSLGLAGESGEVIDAIKKWMFQGHDIDPLDLLNEIGDVLWYLTLMCSAFGYGLDYAIEANIKKLRKRYPNGFDSRQSINR